ncbi:pyruvate, water dikinase regulatory protein [Collinsella provencensis]|uniref:pyruvate, water dikinase regulatory protein n=1 Tax=Collinsella provencensis TaxID=1937461 RepID=UPI000C82F7AE|nr:pyruvate, water dikinase regulatory protein [Collinsella provencensis]
MLQFDPTAQNIERTILIISDALGNTAHGLALAALGQFDADAARIVRLSKITSISQVEEHFAEFAYESGKFAVIQTIASPALSKDVSIYLNTHDIPFIDALGPAISLVAGLTGMTPKGIPGVTHRVDERYFERIEAMEYFVEHDDGRGADDLSRAEIVLLGISRTGKTPLSMYLAFQGYRVANIPLMHGVEPPASVYDIDPAKLFGLISTTNVVSSIRQTRIGEEVARGFTGTYASPEHVSLEMDEAHALMRRLGCFIVRTDKRAIEETASEIISRIELVAAARARRNMA